MLESHNSSTNKVLYVIIFIVTLGMTLWFGLFPAWMSGVFGGTGLFGVRATFIDYATTFFSLTLPFVVYYIGKRRQNIILCSIAPVIPYVLFHIGIYLGLAFR